MLVNRHELSRRGCTCTAISLVPIMPTCQLLAGHSAVSCSASAGWTTSEHPLSAWAVTSRRMPAQRQAISFGCRDRRSGSEHAGFARILWGRRTS